MVNAGEAVIAVLAASTEQRGNSLATPDAEDELLSLAQAIARLLVDILKWFSDDPEG